ncbi:MAG: serine/threonine-protein kinase [Kofleriaceae bacterium]
MARAALVAAGAVLLAAGAGVAGFGATRKASGGMTPETSSMMTSAIEQLAGDIRSAQAALKGEAGSVGGLLQVQAGVASDAATFKQLQDDGQLQFSAKPGEIVEVGQVVKASGEVKALMTLPDGAMRSTHAGKVGSYVELVGDKALVTEVQAVTPKANAELVSGYVMVEKPLDLGPAFSKIEAAHVAGSISIDGKERKLGDAPANAVAKEMTLDGVPNAKVTVLSPPVTGGPQTPLVAGGGGLAGLGLILLIVGLVTGKKASASSTGWPAGTQPPIGSQPDFGTAQTQMSSSRHAAGTPAPIDSTASFSTANLGPGAMIGRWEIIKRIGSGGMADVYLARARGEAGFEKQVAVKVMHPHLARNERAVDHFLDEAKLAARIDHPNVVQIQDLGKIGNDYVIVMEYVDGVDLEKLLASARAAQRPVPVEVGLAILCRVCDGLNAAHRSTSADGQPMNLVHRDVKSANVLVSKQGGVKVVDFGIAKAASQNHLTVAGETKGTPSMMAPEQRVGETVDVRADVYSVGAMAFEIMTGHGVNLDLAALAHLGVENWPHLPMPSSLRPQLPIELDKLLMQCMSFDREKRPANCAELEASFEGVMKKYGLVASDKDIARWVSSEVAALMPSQAELTAGSART